MHHIGERTMNESFKKRYRQLGLATAVVFAFQLVVLVLALVEMLVELPSPVPNFFGLAGGLSAGAAGLIGLLFLITTFLGAVRSWRDRQRKAIA
jgi:hypothetical protein